MLKKIALAVALFATLGTVHAYQAEVGATLAYVDPDLGDSTLGFGADGTYYFNGVQVKDSPLNEAGFLNRASNLSGSFNYADNDDVTASNLGVGIEFFMPNSDFYASASFNHIDNEIDFGGVKIENDWSTYGVELGYLPAPGLLIAAGIRGWDNDYDDGIDPTLRAKFVGPMGSNTVNLEAYIGFGDLDEFRLQADYYFDRTLSAGVDYYDNDLYDEFGLNVKKFFNQQISLEGRLGFGDNEDNLSIRGAYRF